MQTRKQKLALVISMLTALVLGMATVSGCALFTEEKIAATASIVLETAYVAGGACMVSQKIDQMVEDGKITAEQAALLKAAAQKSYEDLLRSLRDKGLADVEVTVTKQTSSPTVAHKRPLSGFCVYRTFNFARSIYSSKRSGSTICAK